jgi:hypothetical protein
MPLLISLWFFRDGELPAEAGLTQVDDSSEPTMITSGEYRDRSSRRTRRSTSFHRRTDKAPITRNAVLLKSDYEFCPDITKLSNGLRWVRYAMHQRRYLRRLGKDDNWYHTEVG